MLEYLFTVNNNISLSEIIFNEMSRYIRFQLDIVKQLSMQP